MCLLGGDDSSPEDPGLPSPLQGSGAPLLPEWCWGRPKGGRARACTPAQRQRASFSPSAEVAPCSLTAERRGQLRTLCPREGFCRNTAQSRPFQRKESYSLIIHFTRLIFANTEIIGKKIAAGHNPTYI